MLLNAEQTLSQKGLIEYIKSTFADCPDGRKGKNCQYTVSDAILSAFSVFFMQSPSFLAHQRTLQDGFNRNNLESLFGTHKIPSDEQIRNIVDEVPPPALYPAYRMIFNALKSLKKVKEYEVLNQQLAVILDGTQYYHSRKIRCPHCREKKLRDGTIAYVHDVVTPIIASPDKRDIIPLPPEFISNKDGAKKQDCELNASYRWLAREREHLPDNVTVLGDDLYCHQPWCEAVLADDWNFLLVCKRTSHKTLYEWLDEFEELGHIQQFSERYWNGKQHITTHYRWMNTLPLRDSEDALQVNWLEAKVVNQKGKALYYNTFVTNHKVTRQNVAEMVKLARCRWKIENENNNTLKTKGYHFEHNFGHGSKHLSETLATLIILAYLLHTVLRWYDVYYQILIDFLPRQTFYNDIKALTKYMTFESWRKMMIFMVEGLELEIPNEN